MMLCPYQKNQQPGDPLLIVLFLKPTVFNYFYASGGKLLTTKILLEGKHYILLPEVIWKVLVSWYSSNAYSIIPTLPRMVSFNNS